VIGSSRRETGSGGSMSAMGPVWRLRAARGSGLAGGIAVLRVIGLVALLWAVAREHLSDGSRTVPAPWLVTTAAAWLCWLISWRRAPSSRVTLACLAVLAGAGGVVAGFAPVGIAFPAIAVLAASMAFDAVPALGVAGVGAVALTVSVLLLGTPRSIIAEGLLAIVAAVVGGASRRQYRDRAAQAEALLSERMRADAERDRATALAERNRIGREIHDVLAHSLGALSVQLEAADALLENGTAAAAAVRPLLRQARGFAVEGLSETRAAVQALRDEPVALTEQLTALAEADGADLTISGAARPLPAGVALALYRAAQEALSNARKHAPGASVSLCLTFDAAATVLRVTNGLSTAAEGNADLSRSGSGFGLRGMRERVELLGGEVVAEPHERGFTVRVAVPA
jgi:signal transduction histidine kinase